MHCESLLLSDEFPQAEARAKQPHRNRSAGDAEQLRDLRITATVNVAQHQNVCVLLVEAGALTVDELKQAERTIQAVKTLEMMTRQCYAQFR